MMVKETLNIAFISHFNYGIDKYGIATYNEKYLKHMSKRGHHIDFYTVKPIKNYKKNPMVNYIFSPIIPKFPFYYLYYFIKLPILLKKKNYDIIHTTCGSGLFLKKIDITTFHHYEKFRITRDIAYFHYFPIKVEVRKVNHIIAISNLAKEQLIKFENRNPKYISVIHQGIDCKRFIPRDKFKVRKILNLPLDKKIGLFVGLIDERKNPFLLIKIAQTLKKKKINATIVMIGTGSLKNIFINEVMRNNLKNYFLFYENVDDIELFYNSADFLINPSVLEGFGLIFIESVSSGKYFVGFPTGIGPIIAKNGYGIICNNTQDFIKKCILNFKNPKILEQTKAHDFIVKNFSDEKCIKETEKVYFKYIKIKKKKSKVLQI